MKIEFRWFTQYSYLEPYLQYREWRPEYDNWSEWVTVPTVVGENTK